MMVTSVSTVVSGMARWRLGRASGKKSGQRHLATLFSGIPGPSEAPGAWRQCADSLAVVRDEVLKAGRSPREAAQSVAVGSIKGRVVVAIGEHHYCPIDQKRRKGLIQVGRERKTVVFHEGVARNDELERILLRKQPGQLLFGMELYLAHTINQYVMSASSLASGEEIGYRNCRQTLILDLTVSQVMRNIWEAIKRVPHRNSVLQERFLKIASQVDELAAQRTSRSLPELLQEVPNSIDFDVAVWTSLYSRVAYALQSRMPFPECVKNMTKELLDRPTDPEVQLRFVNLVGIQYRTDMWVRNITAMALLLPRDKAIVAIMGQLHIPYFGHLMSSPAMS